MSRYTWHLCIVDPNTGEAEGLFSFYYATPQLAIVSDVVFYVLEARSTKGIGIYTSSTITRSALSTLQGGRV